MPGTWKRPVTLASPTTWGIHEGRKPMANGKKPRFRIQDCTDEWIEPLIQHMATYFLVDEPCCSHAGLANDKDGLDEICGLWRTVLSEHIGLIALLDNAEELEDDSLPLVAGCNATFPQFPDAKDPDLKAQSMQRVFNIVKVLINKGDCFKKYNANVSMHAFGLSVHPVYRGQGLAEPILRARFPLCRAVGIPITVTVFSGVISQRTARNAGFETLAELKPEEYVEDGKMVFKGMKSDRILLMAAKIPAEC